MPIDITMPRLSDTMEQGTVVSWNIKEGDEVSAGDTIADIETDKATMELQAFDDGVLAKIVASEGDTVDVGSLIAVLAEEGEDVSEAAQSAGESAGESAGQSSGGEKKQEGKKKAQGASDDADASESQSSTAVAEPPEQDQQQTSAPAARNGAASPAKDGAGSDDAGDDSGGRVFASPLARKVADEKGVDLAALTGSGPSGRIVQADVEAAAQSEAGAAKTATEKSATPAPAPGGGGLEARTIELSNMRRTIARRLVESKTTVPHYQVTVSADMAPLMDLRAQLNDQLEAQNVKLSVNDFLVRAAALAMHQHPQVNARWNEDTIEINADVNIGVAVALPEERGGGLVVATIRGADAAGLRHISAETRRLAKKAREKGLTIEEMEDSTFTISNLGMFGVDHFNAIINPPNVAILAVGATQEIPVVSGGEIAIGHRMAMTMSSDHRVIDGAMAAAYLATLKGLLEAPAALLV